MSFTILQKIKEKTVKIAGYTVRPFTRLSIKLSLEEARQMNAVMMQEVVDRKKIKALYQSGQVMAGVSEIKGIQIISPQSPAENLDDCVNQN